MPHDDFQQVDFFVLVLWDRWPVGARYEYEFAIKCRDDPTMPMQHVVPFFKAVAPRQLSDPGAGLEEVLRFKDALEAERRTRFESFTTIDTFTTRLRSHLSRWLIEHDTRQRQAATEMRIAPSAAPERGEGPHRAPRPHPLSDDPRSYNEYGLFLQRQGMLDKAEEMYQRAIELLGDREPTDATIVAYGSLGAIYRRRRKFSEAEEKFEKALELGQEINRPKAVAASYGGLGLVHLRRDDLDKAEEMFRCALDVETELGRGRGMSWVYENLALIQDLRGHHDKAEESRRLARAVGEEAEYPDGELFPADI
jgi:tetratricopeptide (TPR) repeat protein